MKVLTCTTDVQKKEYQILKLLCPYYGYELIGNTNMKWKGFRTKMKLFSSELKKLNPNELVMCVDAYDTLPVKHSNSFEKQYLQNFSEYEIVSSGETTCLFGICTPLKNRQELSNRKYVNSGLMCGKASNLLKFWNWALNNNFTDDQVALCHYFNAFPHLTTLDYSNILFQTSVTRSFYPATDNDNCIMKTLNEEGAHFLHLPALQYFDGQQENYLRALNSITKKLKLTHHWKKIPITERFITTWLLRIIGILLLLFIIQRFMV